LEYFRDHESVYWNCYDPDVTAESLQERFLLAAIENSTLHGIVKRNVQNFSKNSLREREIG